MRFITPLRRGLHRLLGVRFHPRRLLVAPRVMSPVTPEDMPAGDMPAGTVTVPLRGVVCSVCAARTATALSSVPGVEAVTVDLASSRATLRYAPGEEPDRAALQRALDEVVVARGLRRWVERAVGSRGLRRSRVER